MRIDDLPSGNPHRQTVKPAGHPAARGIAPGPACQFIID